jgi:hypothetical protein
MPALWGAPARGAPHIGRVPLLFIWSTFVPQGLVAVAVAADAVAVSVESVWIF